MGVKGVYGGIKGQQWGSKVYMVGSKDNSGGQRSIKVLSTGVKGQGLGSEVNIGSQFKLANFAMYE